MKVTYFNNRTKLAYFKRALVKYCTYAVTGLAIYGVLYIACIAAGY